MDVPYRILEHKYRYENGKQQNEPDKNSSLLEKSEGAIIHGDNLEALKSLLPEYEGRVKCIYIDPPYNTGNEGWVYNDNVNDPKIKKWLGETVGRESDDLTRHDKWLCMMYPRLKLLHKLLDDSGFVAISIDDNEVFGDKKFDTPKPLTLIEWIINLMNDSHGIVLDSFAGSGTTAHAVLNLNKQDGGKRKFILVEMEDYAENITAERVKRVIDGYGGGSKKTEGTGGSFDYYELGQPLFMDKDVLNEEVELEKIRQYVWFSETHKPYKTVIQTEEHLLGVSGETAYYFYYYKNRLTTLDDSFLRTLKTKAGQYIIYADLCVLDSAIMQKYHITFKKIPRDITRF